MIGIKLSLVVLIPLILAIWFCDDVSSSVIGDITLALYSKSNRFTGGVLNNTVLSGLRILTKTCAAISPRILFTRLRIDNTDRVRYDFYSRRKKYRYDVYNAPYSIPNHLDFESQGRTVIFIHGFNDDASQETSQTIVASYLAKETPHNIIVMDIGSYVGNLLYLRAVRFVPQLGEQFSEFLENLIANGVPSNNIHIVGFSIGAHVAGIAARLLKHNTRITLPRITALDPANPCFSRQSGLSLNKNDASYVDVIHTSQGTLGLLNPIGHADFYVNGVTSFQPGCENLSITCSHSRSWMLYAQSVLNENGFPAKKCETWSDLSRMTCSQREETVMGYASYPNSRGLFLVKTLGYPPYTRYIS